MIKPTAIFEFEYCVSQFHFIVRVQISLALLQLLIQLWLISQKYAFQLYFHFIFECAHSVHCFDFYNSILSVRLINFTNCTQCLNQIIESITVTI